MANITIKGRDLFEILQTVPGVTFGNALLSGSGADATSNAANTFGSLQINGGGTARTNFVVDGVPDVDNGNNSQVDFEPTMDTIAEIRVLTSNYQAEFGHSSGGQISLITKGGSTSFHGSAFYNKRHEMFNAKDYLHQLERQPEDDFPLRGIRLLHWRAGLHSQTLEHGKEQAVLLLVPGVHEDASRPAPRQRQWCLRQLSCRATSTTAASSAPASTAFPARRVTPTTTGTTRAPSW